jgi:molybdopterin-synthase adenylyltransferase
VNEHDHREHGPSDRPRVGVLEGRLTPERATGSRSRDPVATYRLRPSIEVFPASTGELYLLRPGDDDLVIRDPSEADIELARALVHGGTAAELGRRTGIAEPALHDKLSALRAAGLLLETAERGVLPASLGARFDRQLPYLAESGDPASLQERLRSSTVAVLGCGGLGTWTLGAMASAGIGHFVLIDDDTVELSNLNRQILYGVDDLGKPKVERAAAWLERFDPTIGVVTHRRRVTGTDQMVGLLAGADALVLAADWPAYELGRWVDGACRAALVPFVMAAQVPPMLKVGPTYVPGVSACFACQERQIARDFPLYLELTEHRRRDSAPATTLGPASGLVGTVVAMEVMHLCAGMTPVATQGRSWLVDMRTLETRWEVIPRLDDCPACQHLPV